MSLVRLIDVDNNDFSSNVPKIVSGKESLMANPDLQGPIYNNLKSPSQYTPHNVIDCLYGYSRMGGGVKLTGYIC